ncbi:MAG: bifunctional proline dehydrogenase/L-glutamate gamma-semialdehyde dehydrogenase PutA [Pseudomonadota bacterium]
MTLHRSIEAWQASDEAGALRGAIRRATLAEEEDLVRRLAEATGLDALARPRIADAAAGLVRQVREDGKVGMMEQLLAEYGLSTDEGVALMCLAEAMLRVPDSETVDALIRDKITPHDWASHIGDSGSILVNASTWALMLTGRVLDASEEEGVVSTLHRMVRRIGEPVVRRAVGQAMAEMGRQFVLGETIETAMGRGRAMEADGYTYSYDMLGEAARTEADAARYRDNYAQAISAIGRAATSQDIRNNPGISVKLSALHPRYEESQRGGTLPDLSGRLLDLAKLAKGAGIGFNIDAEEADRLDLSLDVIETVLAEPSLKGWDGFGVVVQAYGRRAMPVIDWLYGLADALDRRIMVRLVKGAYWDMEIKRAQVMGLADYPVFTRKAHTDVSYLAAARKLFSMGDRVYPQFATHNAHSVAAILDMAPKEAAFEFQRLHGMGEALHGIVKGQTGGACRIYAPVGAHQDLLAYLVRRLLENGANSSFVNQIVDEDVPPEEIAQDPIAQAEGDGFRPNPALGRPEDLFAPRPNSKGWDLSDRLTLAAIEEGRAPFAAPHRWEARPISPRAGGGTERNVTNPADPADEVGRVVEANAELCKHAIGAALAVQPVWEAAGASFRAGILREAANAYEAHASEIFALLAREAGKTLGDGVAELREAVDFLRYYAAEAERSDMGKARGVVIAISPWNFPLAIFTGQIAAALAAGNAVIAKPAEQTPLIAHRAVSWLLEAGVPEGILQLLPGDGADVGAPLVADHRIGGVVFTGSTEVAKIIDRQLADTAPHAMLIAETGGLNAMVVDSTALLEQATRDIVRAAFQSAGQRCSALRMLYVQDDVADDLLEMISGAVDLLVTGDPWDLATDVSPLIDGEAHRGVAGYVAEAAELGRIKKTGTAPASGLFVAPTLVEVDGIDAVEREIFGPVLHVARFRAEDLDQVIETVNGRGYGLTFGLHTRIDERVQRVLDRIDVGNVYVNRDQIGAIVESQPFGGHGLSGTGPKAGGPLYLSEFGAVEQTDGQGPSGEPLAPSMVAAALSKLNGLDWAERADRIAHLNEATNGAFDAELEALSSFGWEPKDLPGPTGEANRWSLKPLGKVLCLGTEGDAIRGMVLQALAAGNAVLAVAPNASSAFKALADAGDVPLLSLDGTLDPSGGLDWEIDAVATAYGGSAWADLRRAMAARPGPILRLIGPGFHPAAYCHESSVSIDTTAAGGNASLLAAAGA